MKSSGFKLKIDAFALPLIGIGGIGLIFFGSPSKPFHVCRHLIGFGFLFLGLDYMKTSVETLTHSFDISLLPDYGGNLFNLGGARDQVRVNIGAAMVIGANVGTTITVLIGSLGGIPAKKRVGMSHLIFNGVTGAVAFLGIHGLIGLISIVIDIPRCFGYYDLS